ncbi:MAG: FecR domain-containing protein, partial [Acidobacteria bacterium]|nr:FecR domain-containing protein [Acidobacteriota bacterium]
SVAVVLLALFAFVLAVLSFTFPEHSGRVVDKAGNFLGDLATRIGILGGPDQGPVGGEQQANFTQIDGTVRVKKAVRGDWVAADYKLPLEKGDVVQTDAEGIAKIVFTDGTNYTVKPDSLIVIEENSTNEQRQTQVKVQVTSGTVDLATAEFGEGSSSQVKVAGATASLASDSAAQVRNDPKADRHEILVTKGSSEVTRGSEVVRLTDFEKVSFTAEGGPMTKGKEIAPPILISPANMMSIFIRDPVNLAWTPMANARQYHVQVSRNPYFSSTVLDKRVVGTEMAAPPLQEGAYYWVVQSVDGQGKESAESEKNRFNVIPKGADTPSLRLVIEDLRQHGRVIEIRGETEPGARVMVNGQEVPDLSPVGKFTFFTSQMSSGQNTITITAQNAKGGVNTLTRKVIIP